MQQVHLPVLSKTNKTLIIVMVASFIIHSLAMSVFKIPLAQILGLSLSGIKSGFIFQFLTYPLANVGLMEVLFTGLLFWFLGSELESLWGQRRYIGYLIMITLLTGIIYILISAIIGGAIAGYPFHGMAAFSSAMCVSYAVLYPDRLFQFFFMIPVKAKYFCMILAAMALYQGVFTPGGAQAWGQLSAMGFGFAFIFLLTKPWFDQILMIGQKKGGVKKKSKSKANLRIVKDDDEPPKYWH